MEIEGMFSDVSTVVWTIAAIIWLLLATWPARVAHRKGHSFFGYFIFSLFFFPAALITAYLVRNRRRVSRRRERREDRRHATT
jgi:Zn-dependent protease with chaperone function